MVWRGYLRGYLKDHPQLNFWGGMHSSAESYRGRKILALAACAEWRGASGWMLCSAAGLWAVQSNILSTAALAGDSAVADKLCSLYGNPGSKVNHQASG